jgi:hypothetical protein
LPMPRPLRFPIRTAPCACSSRPPTTFGRSSGSA